MSGDEIFFAKTIVMPADERQEIFVIGILNI